MIKGEKHDYFQIIGLLEDDSDECLSLEFFLTWEEALKYCCDLNWKAQYFGNIKSDISLKIIKITTEVMT